jgi:hypothetical protein
VQGAGARQCEAVRREVHYVALLCTLFGTRAPLPATIARTLGRKVFEFFKEVDRSLNYYRGRTFLHFEGCFCCYSTRLPADSTKSVYPGPPDSVTLLTGVPSGWRSFNQAFQGFDHDIVGVALHNYRSWSAQETLISSRLRSGALVIGTAGFEASTSVSNSLN